MMDIAIRPAARPGHRCLVYLCAALAGVAAGLVIGLAALAPERIPAEARVVTVTPVSGFGSVPGRTYVPNDINAASYSSPTVSDPCLSQGGLDQNIYAAAL